MIRSLSTSKSSTVLRALRAVGFLKVYSFSLLVFKHEGMFPQKNISTEDEIIEEKLFWHLMFK